MVRLFSSEMLSSLTRRKVIPKSQLTATKLARVLNVFDLTLLSVGTTLGLGVYVLPGKIAATKSGPSIIVSFTIAAIASLLSSLCYAEFASRVPRAGSVYVYSYVTIGELVAFIVGWDLILEYMIGTASVARGYSEYIDSLCNGAISSKLESMIPINVQYLSKYPDILAAVIILILAILLSIGVKESTRFNSLFTLINLSVIIFILICGFIKSDIKNWTLATNHTQQMKPERGSNVSYESISALSVINGFFPYGFTGVMQGAATCFYCYLGFDIIATSAEETINPSKTIPFSIGLSLMIVFISYFLLSCVMTLMWPYYELNTQAPLAYIFDKLEMPYARWITSIGAIFGLSTSLLGAIFPLPRIIYSMAQDGLIFSWLGSVNSHFKTPINATIISCTIAIILTIIFDVNQLADMMSIGTLVAYSLGAICVVILRYRTDDFDDSLDSVDYSADSMCQEKNIFSLLYNFNNYTIPNESTSQASATLTFTACKYFDEKKIIKLSP